MMFGWLFGKKKTETKVTQKTEVTGARNRVTQTTNVVNQRGAKASGDIVGGNKITAVQRVTSTTDYDPTTDLLNPINPLSPLNPMNQPQPEPKAHTHSHDSGWSSSSSHSHSHDSGSSWSSHSHSHDSGSSYSSYDSSSSSSFDSGGHH